MSLADQERRMMQRMENSIAATPTQAQREAAAKAIRAILHKDHRGAKGAEALAEAALTAAAEVGDELESGVLLTKAIDEVIAEDIEKERLQELVSQGIQIERQLRKELLTLRGATIERCAQVAASYQGYGGGGYAHHSRTIAAAIRALSSK